MKNLIRRRELLAGAGAVLLSDPAAAFRRGAFFAGSPWLVGYGDSLMYGTGSTIYPTDTWRYKLATALGRQDSNQGIGGESSTMIANRFCLGIDNQGNLHPELAVQNAGGWGDARTLYVLNGGYNNIANFAGTIEADFKRMTDLLDATRQRYVVMGPPTADVPELYIGGSSRSAWQAVCTNLLAYYGSRYYDTDGTLKAQSTHTGQDAIDDSHGIVPSSQRADGVHWNNAGQVTTYQGMLAKVQALGYG